MYWYTRYYVKLINSSAFLADAWHHCSDVSSSICSLIGIGGAMRGFPVMDSVASVIICLFIVKASYDILKGGVVKLLDAHKVAEHVHDEVEHTFPDAKHIMAHLNLADEASRVL